MSNKDWFVDWFDTPYYHILYQNRNDLEAKKFIQTLMGHLKLPSSSKLLDLACGKGRHSKTLNELGYDVLGVDLSENSINEAIRLSNDTLSFRVHDMREVLVGAKFDAIFNLFTSFGYFDSNKENERMCASIAQMLLPNGKLIIDFMNVHKVIKYLVNEEEKEIDGIRFYITRTYDDSHIEKHIKFNHKGEQYHFTERVQGLKLDDFKTLLAPFFTIDQVFGSLDFQPFVLEKSDRLIIIASRKNEL